MISCLQNQTKQKDENLQTYTWNPKRPKGHGCVHRKNNETLTICIQLYPYDARNLHYHRETSETTIAFWLFGSCQDNRRVVHAGSCLASVSGACPHDKGTCYLNEARSLRLIFFRAIYYLHTDTHKHAGILRGCPTRASVVLFIEITLYNFIRSRNLRVKVQ
jgi:hypothetical protein